MLEEMLRAFWRVLAEVAEGGDGGLKLEDQRHDEKGCLRALRLRFHIRQVVVACLASST